MSRNHFNILKLFGFCESGVRRQALETAERIARKDAGELGLLSLPELPEHRDRPPGEVKVPVPVVQRVVELRGRQLGEPR